MSALSVSLAAWVLAANPVPPKGVVVTASAPPVLVMVRTNGNSSFEKSQQRLHEELTLLLDSFMVILTPVETKDFAKKPLADQISVVLPLSKANDAVAVVWLAEPLPGQMMLHLVAMGTGRTLVRTLEFDRRSQTENVLALMLRELLGTAFLFEPVPTVPKAVRTLVSQVRKTMPAMEELEPPPVVVRPPAVVPRPKPCGWCVRVAGGAQLEAGLGEAVGPTGRYGVSANVTGLLPMVELDVGLSLELLGFSSKVFEYRLAATSLPLFVTAAWRGLKTTSVKAGPVIGVGPELTWTNATSTVKAANSKFLFTAGPAAFVGFEAQLSLGPVSLWGRLDVLFRTRRPQLIETTDANGGWKLSSVTLRATIGLAWEGS